MIFKTTKILPNWQGGTRQGGTRQGGGLDNFEYDNHFARVFLAIYVLFVLNLYEQRLSNLWFKVDIVIQVYFLLSTLFKIRKIDV